MGSREKAFSPCSMSLDAPRHWIVKLAFPGKVMSKPPLKSIFDRIETFSSYAFNATLWVPAAMVGLITYDVLSRYLLNSPSLFSDEIASYMLVFMCFIGAGGTLKDGRHIGVDVLTGRLKARARLRLELITSSVSLIFVAIFWWHSVVMVYYSYIRNVTVPSSLLTPLWIPQTFIPIGMFFLLLQLIVEIAKLIEKVQISKKAAHQG